MTDPAFMPQKGQPSYWFRTDPEEVAVHRRMIETMERLAKLWREMTKQESKHDSVQG